LDTAVDEETMWSLQLCWRYTGQNCWHNH